MAYPTQLSAPEQDTLVKQIGLALLRAAPRDWQRISASYRTVGRYHELDGEITLADGTATEWVATHDIATLFGRLRAGMYREERGTWSNARYTLDAPASYNLEYDREEPEWNLLPPNQAYADELRMFPRSDENVPEWLMRRLAGLGPERPGPRLRIARVFDGADESGRPVINRPELEPDEQDRVLDYLADAPMVRPGRGLDIDRLAGTPEPAVPVGFHSDGVWIWPAAVQFYLQEYGVTPDHELVDHIRANDYQVPAVSDEQRAAATEYLTRGNPAPEQPAALAAPPMPRGPDAAGRHPVAPPLPGMGAPVAGAGTAGAAVAGAAGAVGAAALTGGPGSPGGPGGPGGSGGPGRPGGPEINGVEATQVWTPPADLAGQDHDDHGDYDDGDFEDYEDFEDHGELAEVEPEEPADLAADAHRKAQVDVGTQYFHPITDEDPDAEELPDAELPVVQQLRPDEHLDGPSPVDDRRFEAPPAPAQGLPSPAPRVDNPLDEPLDEPALERLHARLDELGVPATEYRIGGPTKLGWSLEQVPEGWRVGWYEDSLADSSVFGDPDDATAFMLGKVLLEPNGRISAGPDPDAGRHESADELAPLPVVPADLPVHGRHDADLGRDEDDEPPAGAAKTKPAVAPAAPGLTEPHHVPPAAPQPAPPAPKQAPPSRPPAGVPSSGAPSAPGNWPIQPMPGEPPLTLFRGKRLEDLPVGSELDRFGGPDGNLTYVAGTPFEERSLVPEWVNRPYHVYRVQRPFEALTGVSIPWFSQPGGGSAYILPASVEELLADGVLIELDPGEPPID